MNLCTAYSEWEENGDGIGYRGCSVVDSLGTVQKHAERTAPTAH